VRLRAPFDTWNAEPQWKGGQVLVHVSRPLFKLHAVIRGLLRHCRAVVETSGPERLVRAPKLTLGLERCTNTMIAWYVSSTRPAVEDLRLLYESKCAHRTSKSNIFPVRGPGSFLFVIARYDEFHLHLCLFKHRNHRFRHAGRVRDQGRWMPRVPSGQRMYGGGSPVSQIASLSILRG
jgi:hypothetical protein